MRLFDAAAVTDALPFERLVAVLDAMFARGCAVPERQSHAIEPPAGAADAEPLRSLVMAAWLPGRGYGVKVINIQPGNAARALPALHASYLLFDAASGVPLALLDGDALTARRTAATSALAAAHLARADARRLLVLGAGRIARLLAAAHRTVRPSLAEFVVWARRPKEAEALAAEWRDAGLEARAAAVDALAAEAARADIVSCATLARSPVVRGEWLAPGTHLDLVGSFAPDMREADDAAIAQALLYVDTEEAMGKSGDLLAPLASGAIRAGHLRGTLAMLARGEVPGRTDPAARTVFKSVGSALEDLAAALLVHESSCTDA